MKTITIKKNENVFTLKISNNEHHRVIDFSQEEFEVLRDECNKHTIFVGKSAEISDYQNILQASHKQAETIYKKHLEIFFQPK